MHSLALASLGLACLATGLWVSLAYRPAGLAQWWPQAWAAWGGQGPVPAWAGSLPSLAHVLGFSLLAAPALPATRAAAWLNPAAWCALNLAAEALQHPALAEHLSRWWPVALEPGSHHLNLGPALLAYAQRGHFDPLDAVAACLGAALATVCLLPRKESRACSVN